MNQNECLQYLEENHISASELFNDRCPKLSAKFRRRVKALAQLLEEVREEFPDATFYTGSGGLNILLGDSHDGNCREQSVLLADSASDLISISDGDF